MGPACKRLLKALRQDLNANDCHLILKHVATVRARVRQRDRARARRLAGAVRHGGAI